MAQAHARRQQIQARLNYLSALPFDQNVMNEINFLQNQLVALNSQEPYLNDTKLKLENWNTNLRWRVQAARDILMDREAKLRDLSDQQSSLERRFSSEWAEMNTLSSLDGQNACSEAALASARTELDQKHRLVDEIQDLKSQSTAVLSQSEATRSKIETLLEETTL